MYSRSTSSSPLQLCARKVAANQTRRPRLKHPSSSPHEPARTRYFSVKLFLKVNAQGLPVNPSPQRHDTSSSATSPRDDRGEPSRSASPASPPSRAASRSAYQAPPYST